VSTLNIAASRIDRLGELRMPGDCALEQEEPVFAATSDFAAEFGGPITRAFLQALPDAWRTTPLVVDTSLVWLPEGASAGPLLLHREPYPESVLRGVRVGKSGSECGARQRHARSSGWELVTGVMPPALLQSVLPMNHFHASKDAIGRDATLRELVGRGVLALVRIAPGEIVRYPASAFIRHLPATHAGFHYSMRATRGSNQPLVNGFRTVV
jgi:hypothetical protein